MTTRPVTLLSQKTFAEIMGAAHAEWASRSLGLVKHLSMLERMVAYIGS